LYWKNPVVPLPWSTLDIGLYFCFIISNILVVRI
jgi:hypothetical protein